MAVPILVTVEERDDLRVALSAVETDPALPQGNYRVVIAGDAYAAVSAGSVPKWQAVAVVEAPAALRLYGYARSLFFVATKQVTVKDRPFVCVAIGREVGEERLVDAAFRLYGVDHHDVDAGETFVEVLMRYGIPYRADARVARWTPVVQVPRTGGSPFNDIMAGLGVALTPGKPVSLSAQVRALPDGKTWEIAWPIVVDTQAYRDDVRRHS